MNWSIYDTAFASMEAEINTIYADHLMSDFLATEADGGSPKEGFIARVRRWWHNFCQLLRDLRTKFVEAAKKKWEAIKKLFGVMDRAPATVEMEPEQASKVVEIGAAAGNLSSQVDALDRQINDLEKLTNQLFDSRSNTTQTLTEMNRTMDEMLKEIEQRNAARKQELQRLSGMVHTDVSEDRRKYNEALQRQRDKQHQVIQFPGATDSFLEMQSQVDLALEADSSAGKRKINISPIRSKLKELGQKANKGNERCNALMQVLERFSQRKASESTEGDATVNAEEQKAASKLMQLLRVIGGFIQQAATAVAGAWHHVFPKREKTVVVPNTDIPDLSQDSFLVDPNSIHLG